MPLNCKIVFCGGIVIGAVLHSIVASGEGETTQPASPRVSFIDATSDFYAEKPRSDDSNVRNQDTSSIEEVGANEVRTYQIPKSLANVVLPALVESDGCSLMPVSLFPYGLSEREADSLVGFINEVASSIRRMEQENSSLKTTAEGNQYFEIHEFKIKGQELKKRLEHGIANAFSKFDDDRGEIFLAQLLKSSLFDDFGQTTREISLDSHINPDGSEGVVFGVVRYDGDREVSRSFRGGDADVALMRTRYSMLVEKYKNEIYQDGE